MSVLFKLLDSNGGEIEFNDDEAVDTAKVKEYYKIEVGQAKSASGSIKQQIRPNARFAKSFRMVLTEAKYILFIRLLTNQSDNYYMQYTIAPTLLTNDSDAYITNTFKIAIQYNEPTITAGLELTYQFDLGIVSVNLL